MTRLKVPFLLILLFVFGGIDFAPNSAKAQFSDSWEFLKSVRELDYKEMRRRLGRGANINRLDKDGYPAMVIAADMKNAELLRFLIEMGAKVDVATSPKKETALMRLSSAGSNELIQILLESGADVDLEDNNGETPLMKAARARKYRTIKLLVDQGADVNKTDYTGRTALDMARDTRSKRVIKALEDAGAN